MKIKGRLPGVLMLLSLLQLPTVAVAQDVPFTYSDDWSLVSAPPPPGPYQAVNIDPRVPGQDAIPPVSTDVETVQGWAEMPAEFDAAPPPAAGSPASAPAMEPPVPHGMPGPEPYSKYESMPPSGYYRSPAVQVEEEVPPPSVYDAMTGESGGAYGRPRGQ